MNELIRVAADVQGYCESRRWRFCFIGGLALQRWGEPRETIDVASSRRNRTRVPRIDSLPVSVAAFPTRGTIRLDVGSCNSEWDTRRGNG